MAGWVVFLLSLRRLLCRFVALRPRAIRSTRSRTKEFLNPIQAKLTSYRCVVCDCRGWSVATDKRTRAFQNIASHLTIRNRTWR